MAAYSHDPEHDAMLDYLLNAEGLTVMFKPDVITKEGKQISWRVYLNTIAVSWSMNRTTKELTRALYEAACVLRGFNALKQPERLAQLEGGLR